MAVVTPLTNRSRANGTRDGADSVYFVVAVPTESSGLISDDSSADVAAPVVMGRMVFARQLILVAFSIRRAGRTPTADAGATRRRLSSLGLGPGLGPGALRLTLCCVLEGTAIAIDARAFLFPLRTGT